MCNFLSAVFTKNGDMLCEPGFTDSHAELIAAYNIKDSVCGAHRKTIVKCELTPPVDITKVSNWNFRVDETEIPVDITKVSKWNFRVDETEIPDWFDDQKAEAKMRAVVRRMIIKTKKDVILGGCWILSGKRARINKLIRGRIIAVVDGADLSFANLSFANLSSAFLSGINLSGADLSGADLSWADLSSANLSGAFLSGAGLSGAGLSGADLSGANLYMAGLSEADLSGANLTGANLTGAIVSLPDNWELKNGISVRQNSKL